MIQANGVPAQRRAMYKNSAENIAEWIRNYEDLIYGVSAFREMGPVAERALVEATEMPDVRRLRLSWELLEALMEGEGLDPEATRRRFSSRSCTRSPGTRCSGPPREVWQGWSYADAGPFGGHPPTSIRQSNNDR